MVNSGRPKLTPVICGRIALLTFQWGAATRRKSFYR
jgi:hypothetical protein